MFVYHFFFEKHWLSVSLEQVLPLDSCFLIFFDNINNIKITDTLGSLVQ